AVIKKAPQTTVAYQSRALAHTRLGHKDEALADLAQFQKGDSTESSRLYLAVVVAAELGEGTDQAFEKLDAALQKQPQDAGLHYDAACAYALASQPLSKKDPAKGRDRGASHPPAPHGDPERLLRLQPHAGGLRPRSSARTPGVCRDHEGRAPGPLLRRRLGGRFPVRGESPLFGLDTTAQLQQCRELVAQGYRMVALSVARTSPGGLPITASVWHRPVITEETKDQLAQRPGPPRHFFLSF